MKYASQCGGAGEPSGIGIIPPFRAPPFWMLQKGGSSLTAWKSHPKSPE